MMDGKMFNGAGYAVTEAAQRLTSEMKAAAEEKRKYDARRKAFDEVISFLPRAYLLELLRENTEEKTRGLREDQIEKLPLEIQLKLTP